MRLLRIDASIFGAASVSRALSAAVVARLCRMHACEVTYRDLVAEPPAHLTRASLPWDHPAAAKGPLDAAQRAIRDDAQRQLDEFVAADVVVIGVAMYNFTVATQLKAWIDRIVVPGRTFRYGAHGPEGLCGDKRVIVVVARGSVYGADPFPASYEHAESYVRTILAFIGIGAPEVIVAQGVMTGEDNRMKAMAQAQAAIERLAA